MNSDDGGKDASVSFERAIEIRSALARGHQVADDRVMTNQLNRS